MFNLKLAHSLVLKEYIFSYWRASEASKTLLGVTMEIGDIYIYMCV